MIGVSPDALRAAFIARQGLRADRWSTVHKAISHVGAVQIDTIAVVARSHHLALRHRVKDYAPNLLWTALRGREVFEYYVHGNAFVPIEDFPYLQHCMARFSTHGYKWLRNSIPKYEKLMTEILHRIREEGPLTSRDFKDPVHRSGGWWNWKPAKSALELLWWMGQILVVDRVGFERVYDLTERAVPSKYLDSTVGVEDVWRYYLKRSLDFLVAATLNDLRNYYNFHIYALDKNQPVKQILLEKVQLLEQEDTIVEVEVENAKQTYYALAQSMPLIEAKQQKCASRDRAWFLSPFDNIVWDRVRVERLFDADVRLEAYVPKAKRRFGYYAMPILLNDRIVGRFDPKVDRKSHTLILENLELSVSKEEESDVLEAVREELAAFMIFHECDQVTIRRAYPARFAHVLC